MAEQEFPRLGISAGADQVDKMDVRNCKLVTTVTHIYKKDTRKHFAY